MLIIEDGTAKEDAESYATVAELVSLAAARGIVLPATEPEQETLLRSAIEYMETLSYKGIRYTRTQALSMPRINMLIDGFYVPHTEIPRQAKAAQLQLALDSMNHDLMADITAPDPTAKGAVLEETVEGAVTMKYAAPASAPVAILGAPGVTADGATLTRARALLRPLLSATGQARVRRG